MMAHDVNLTRNSVGVAFFGRVVVIGVHPRMYLLHRQVVQVWYAQ